MSSPKKHHFVPRLLLDRFTHDGYLWYVPIDRDVALRRTRPREVGHVNGGHTTVSYKGEVDSLSLERQMGVIETEAGAAISALVRDSNMSVVPSDMAAPIAWLASLQSARSRAVLGYLADAVDRLDRGDWGARDNTQEGRTALDRQTALLRATTTQVLHSWHARQSSSGRQKDQWDHVATTLMGMRWDVMRYDERCLAVSDSFAAQYGIRSDAPGDFERSPFMSRFGLNTPLWASEGLTIALTPQVALHLHPGEKRRVAAAAGVNMHTIRSARSFVAFPADFNPASVMPGWIDWIVEARGVRAAMPPAI